MDKTAIPDFFGIDTLLTEEEKTFRQTVRDFVDRECLPIIAEHFDRGSFPMHLVPAHGRAGFVRLACEGLRLHARPAKPFTVWCARNSVAATAACGRWFPFKTRSSCSRSLPSAPTSSAGIGCRRWAGARRSAASAFPSPTSARTPAAWKPRRSDEQDGFVLNGRKMWITNGPIAHLAVIWAKLEGEIRGFLVEAGTPGYHAAPIQRKFAYRTSPTALIRLENCRIPEQNILPGARGLKSVFQCLNLARWGVACGALGSAIACYQAARDFATRAPGVRPPDRLLSVGPGTNSRPCWLKLPRPSLSIIDLGRLLDAGQARPAQLSLAKLNNVREAMTIARAARDILGARGILADQHVIRHLCDLEAVSTLEGTASMHTLVIGQEATGHSAFN